MNLLQPVDPRVDHVRGDAGRVVIEYGDYECPYSRLAYRSLESLGTRGQRIEFVFRHYPLTDAHPHALAAAHAGTPTVFIDGVVYRGELDARGFAGALSG